jgi:PRC-barrel domain protein
MMTDRRPPVRRNNIEALSGVRMRSGQKIMAAILVWSAVLAGASMAADEADKASAPAPGPAVKTAPDAPKEPAPPPSVTVIGAADARGILGRDVRSSAGENMGRIVDVIVDRSGTVRAAVIDFGGFLGVGSRKIVVDWAALHFGQVTNKKESITLELTLEQVKAAPEYKEDTPIVVLGASGTLQPLQFDH